MIQLKILCVVILTVNCGNCATFYNERIINGDDAVEGEFPYQVYLRVDKYFHCGGSILNENFILTAAHCVNESISVDLHTIHAGALALDKGDDQVRIAKRIIVHEGWDSEKVIDDLALIELNEPLVFNRLVQPIALPSEDTPEGTELIITGYGDNLKPEFRSLVLQKLNTKAYNQEKCKVTLLEQDKLVLTEGQICIFAKTAAGACYGDSGGPLALNNKYLVGVASMVIKDCALGFPDVYTRVYKYVDWIKSKTG